jgi:hypothetical protein
MLQGCALAELAVSKVFNGSLFEIDYAIVPFQR